MVVAVATEEEERRQWQPKQRIHERQAGSKASVMLLAASAARAACRCCLRLLLLLVRAPRRVTARAAAAARCRATLRSCSRRSPVRCHRERDIVAALQLDRASPPLLPLVGAPLLLLLIHVLAGACGCCSAACSAPQPRAAVLLLHGSD